MRSQNYQYLSIWEIAHRWESAEIGTCTEIKITSKLGERLRQLIWGATRTLNCYDQHGELIPMETLWFGFPKTRVAKQLDIAFNDPGAHEDFLKTIFLSQDEVKKAYRGMEPLPKFWFDEWELAEEAKFLGPEETPRATKPSPLRPDQQDKATCQTIAKRLWAEHPDMTIADMTKRPEIQIEGNGKAYRGKNTLRNWLKAVAPESVRNRRGRPKKKAAAKKIPS